MMRLCYAFCGFILCAAKVQYIKMIYYAKPIQKLKNISYEVERAKNKKPCLDILLSVSFIVAQILELHIKKRTTNSSLEGLSKTDFIFLQQSQSFTCEPHSVINLFYYTYI